MSDDKVRKYMKHPETRERVLTYRGFCWPGLMFGPAWLALKGLWKYVLIQLGIGVITLGVGGLLFNIVIGYKGNEWHYKHLCHKGFEPMKEGDKPWEKA